MRRAGVLNWGEALGLGSLPLLRGVTVARLIPFATLKIISIRSPASGYLSCPPPKYKGRMKHGRYGRV